MASSGQSYFRDELAVDKRMVGMRSQVLR